MFYLKDKRCYLSGAIEYSQEDNWRDLPKQILKDQFNVNVFDLTETEVNSLLEIIDAIKS